MDDNPFFTKPVSREKIDRLEELLSQPKPLLELTPPGMDSTPSNPDRDREIADAAAEMKRRLEQQRGRARDASRKASR